MKNFKCSIKISVGKWLWSGVEYFWGGIIVEKYGTLEGGWRTRNIITLFGCGFVEEVYE